MYDSINSNQSSKFRQSPFGRLIYNQEPLTTPFNPYTLSLLNSDTSADLKKRVNRTHSHQKTGIHSISSPLSSSTRDKIIVYWQKIEVTGWKPETRQESSLSHISDSLFLIGGVSRSISKDVNVLNLSEKTWRKIENSGEENEPRFGHSTVIYENNLIVFGGGTNYDYKHKLRECLNGVHVFYTSIHKWEYLKTQGTYLPARKYHTACVVGSHMFVYGGMNQRNNFLDDAAVLNLQKKVWKSVEVLGNSPGKIAFHTSAFVMNPFPHSKESIYKLRLSAFNTKIFGVFLFGGLCADKRPTNSVWILNVGKRPLEWVTPVISGQPPCPRFLHTMVYNDYLNLLIVFGGRVDQVKTNLYTCFNDVFLLDVQNMTWLKVIVMGDVPSARSGHTAENSDCQMFIFGGVTNSCYCSSDVWCLELDSSNVSSIGELYMKKIDHDFNREIHKKITKIPSFRYSKSISRTRTKKNSSSSGFDL